MCVCVCVCVYIRAVTEDIRLYTRLQYIITLPIVFNMHTSCALIFVHAGKRLCKSESRKFEPTHPKSGFLEHTAVSFAVTARYVHAHRHTQTHEPKRKPTHTHIHSQTLTDTHINTHKHTWLGLCMRAIQRLVLLQHRSRSLKSVPAHECLYVGCVHTHQLIHTQSTLVYIHTYVLEFIQLT